MVRAIRDSEPANPPDFRSGVIYQVTNELQAKSHPADGLLQALPLDDADP